VAQAHRPLLNGFDERPIRVIGPPAECRRASPPAPSTTSASTSPLRMGRAGVSSASFSRLRSFLGRPLRLPGRSWLCALRLPQIQAPEGRAPCSTDRPPTAAAANGSFFDQGSERQ